jgi:hypothetical protein
MQNSIALVAVGTKADKFVQNYSTELPIIKCQFQDAALAKFRVNNERLERLMDTSINEILSAIIPSEKVIIFGTLGDHNGSVILPALSKRLLETGKVCFALLTTPYQNSKNEDWKRANEMAAELGAMFPSRHCYLLETSKYEETVPGMTEKLYESIVLSFFKDETDRILKYGTIYRIFDLDGTGFFAEGSSPALKLTERSVEELLEMANELWRKRLRKDVHFDPYKTESESIVIELKERGFNFIPEEKFANALLPKLKQDEERKTMLVKILLDKQKLIEQRKFEEVARLRDQEKGLLHQMTSDFLNDAGYNYFFLLRDVEKTIVYRICSDRGMNDFMAMICDIR